MGCPTHVRAVPGQATIASARRAGLADPTQIRSAAKRRQKGTDDCRRCLRGAPEEAPGRASPDLQEGRAILARIINGDLADEFQVALDAQPVADPLLGGHDDDHAS